MKSATFNKNFDTVFAACQKALKQMEISIEVADKENKTITGLSSTSFWSWGETIQINLERVNQFSTKIDVESTSQAQLISWGKNDVNEENIISAVKQILE